MARLGKARQAGARLGMARSVVRLGVVRHGMPRLGKAGQGTRFGKAWWGEARRGQVRPGSAWFTDRGAADTHKTLSSDNTEAITPSGNVQTENQNGNYLSNRNKGIKPAASAS